jgi:hypothetical protein
MSDSLRSILPPILGPLVPDSFDRPAVDEPRATCSSCAMCEESKNLPSPTGNFRPDAKCCTFHPALPNYLVGGLLSDSDPALDEGKRRVREKIANRIGVTPQWISPPRKLRVYLEAARNMGVFGRTRALLCPYYVDESGGSCSVWRYRDAVCTTYFCKYSHGLRGYAFWTKLKEYLTHVEGLLSKYACATVDPAVAEPQIPHLKITVEDLEDRPPNDADYARYWGKWVGKEEAFYLACAEAVRGLGREGFARIVDASVTVRDCHAQLMAHYDKIARPDAPATLVPNPRMRAANIDGTMAVTTYNPCDSYGLPKDVYDALQSFEPDVPVKKIVKRLKQKKGIEIGAELLADLVMHAVLVTPEAAAQARIEDAATQPPQGAKK